AEGRSDVLLDMAAQLHDRGAGTSVLAEMVQAASPDVTDRNDDETRFDDFMVAVLDALDQAEAGTFTGTQAEDGTFPGVEAFVDANRHLLADVAKKHRLLEKLGKQQSRPRTDLQRAQAQAVQFAVSRC
ncbi:hypothetical protein, partial [Actinoplanes sp. NBRC 103695]|uniref:hypothetical protein n=1 Tax=Actinoplanes sp. NBRC 103695 TaxID=3032202 RepID=UPI002556A57F